MAGEVANMSRGSGPQSCRGDYSLNFFGGLIHGVCSLGPREVANTGRGHGNQDRGLDGPDGGGAVTNVVLVEDLCMSQLGKPLGEHW